jgi:hypothetical protein
MSERNARDEAEFLELTRRQADVQPSFDLFGSAGDPHPLVRLVYIP